MILDLGELRLPVPRLCEKPWMRPHRAGRCPNGSWFHKEVATKSQGQLKVKRVSHNWTIKGRGGFVHFDLNSKNLQTFCDDAFWLPMSLRLADLMSRLHNEELACHASAIYKNKKLWLLAGPSGFGKTTASQLAESQGWKIVQDDLVFLKEGHCTSKIDWSDPTREVLPFQKKITGICLLEKAPHHEIISIDTIEAHRRLAPIWGPLHGEPVATWLDHLAREIALIPVFRLRFRRDAGFLNCLNSI